MTTKKKTPAFDEKSPQFVEFKKRFSSNSNKKGDAYYMQEDSSCISDSVVANPPHQVIALELFPDLTVTQFLERSKEIFDAGHSYLEEVPDYYDTHFPRYSFEVNFVKLYAIYLKYQA